MARYSVDSLKSKIRLAASALAFFIGAFGIGSWLIISLFADNSFYSISILFLFSAAAIVVFGWRLSNEVVRPIEKVSLLAKSMERGTSTALPQTSGSSETDELLQTLYRSNQQLQNLVGLMDKVSGGNLDVALAPLEQSDRLSNSFQKLLAKVTESIDAKRDLERLKAAVRQITEEICRVRSGNFDAEIKSDFMPTREISETVKFLIHHLNEVINRVKDDSKQSQAAAKEIQKTLQAVIGADENRLREMNQSTLALKQIPGAVRKISEELSAYSHTAGQSIERAQKGSQTARENLTAASALRQQMRETVKRVGQLGEQTREIGKVAKTIEDLARRTNMIALNASIQAAEAGEHGRGFAALTEEVKRLAERAANTCKQISVLDKTIAAEIGEIERSVQDGASEAANLSKYAIETGSSLGELEKYIGQFLNLQEKLVAYAGGQTAGMESAFQSFAASIAETESAVRNLKESETQIAQVAVAMENLGLAVADFKTSSVVVKEISPPIVASPIAESEFHA
jgi:methyl-accepting chemotaxis protein